MSKFVKYSDVVSDLEKHPCKKVFWRSGFAYRGAEEKEIARADLERAFKWACVVEIDKDNDHEIHLNGLSANDMF